MQEPDHPSGAKQRYNIMLSPAHVEAVDYWARTRGVSRSQAIAIFIETQVSVSRVGPRAAGTVEA